MRVVEFKRLVCSLKIVLNVGINAHGLTKNMNNNKNLMVLLKNYLTFFHKKII